MLFDVIETASPWQDWLNNLVIRQISIRDLPDLINKIRASGMFALDIETTGLDPILNEICLIQIAPGPVPLTPNEKTPVYFLKPEPSIIKLLANLIEDSNILKIGHNLSFDLKFIQAKAGRRLNPRNLFDTMLASQLVTAGDFIPEHQLEGWLVKMGITKIKHGATHYYDKHGHEIKLEKDTAKQTRPVYLSHSLQQVAHRYLEVWLPKEEQTSNWSGELTEEQMVYAARDAAVLLPLYEVLKELIKRNKLEKTAALEFACIPAVIEIETVGMPFDSQKAGEILAEIESSIAGLISAIEVPNINSSAQVRQKLIELGQEYIQGDSFVIEGETFEVSSSDEVLSRIKARLPGDHPLSIFITNLQQYRHLKKKADMLKKWLESVHPQTKRLHTSLKQINNQGVGRFSAREPNLQQISREPEIRALFHAEPGEKLVIADYSGIEMRIMAQLSRDKTLIKAFKDGIDIHKFTASRLSNKPLEEVTKEERQSSKACYSEDTEILTINGWVRFSEYEGKTPVAQFKLEGFDYNPPRSKGNRWIGSRKTKCKGLGSISFIKPEAFYSFEDRELVHYTDRNIDLLVTPDHEVIWLDTNSRPRKQRADKINSGNVRYFIAAGFLEKQDFALNEIETRILAMIAADGSFKSRPGSLIFGFSKPKKIDRCRFLLKTCKLKFKETVYSNGSSGKTVHFIINDKEFINKMLQYISEDKDLNTQAVFDLNPLWYLDEAKYWDASVIHKGKRGERIAFYTVRRKTAEIMQMMAVLSGIPSILRKHKDTRETHSDIYSLSYLLCSSPHPLWRAGCKKKGKLFEPVAGKHKVYCVQVPAGAIVVRRNGKAVICGNCNFGLIYGMAAPTLKEYAEISYGVSMSVEEAKRAREGFFKTYPGIAKWHQKQTTLVSEKNFKEYWVYHPEKGFVCEKRPQVRTLGGRLRVWPVTHQARMSRAGQAESGLKKVGPVTELFNTPDQGTGADMIKLAMIYLYRELYSRQWADVRLIGCVHDELILEAPEEKAEETEKLLVACMLKAAKKLLPDVPVEVEAHIAESWAEK